MRLLVIMSGLAALSHLSLMVSPSAAMDPPTMPTRPQLAAAPPIVVSPPVVDLGLLKPGESGSAAMTLTNAGHRAIRILRSITSCACTAVDLADTTLAPGESVQFKGSMTPKPGLGQKRERITVIVEGYELPVRIDVTAEVSLAIRMTPPHLDAQETMAGIIEVEAQDGRPFRVLRTAGQSPVFVDFKPGVDEPRAKYQLRWDLSGYDRSTMPGWWVIETDRADAAILDARIWHEWTKTPRPAGRWWTPNEQRIVIGCLRADESFEFIVKLQYPRSSPPRSTDPAPATTLAAVTTTSTQFHAELVGCEIELHERQADSACTIRVTARPVAPGLIYGPLTYMTPDGHSDTLTIIGRLVE